MLMPFSLLHLERTAHVTIWISPTSPD